MENYIVINGKKVEVSKEQLETLGIWAERIEQKRNNPFDRVKFGEKYFVVTGYGTEDFKDVKDGMDNRYYRNCGYFNDKDFAIQVYLHELLNRKLLKYAYDNEAEDVEWDGDRNHYYIFKNTMAGGFDASSTKVAKHQEVYFSKREIAKQAIEDVVKPFVAKHPEFVW